MQRKKETMIARYGDRQTFLSKFNPDLQMRICKDKQLCFFGDAPVLSELNMTYGEMTATMWLIPQLYDLSEYCGCKEKLQGRPLEQCASVIAAEFFYLKVSELMLFFHRFKSGRYGRFYGSVDPMVITTALRTFLTERVTEIEERDKREKEIADREARKGAITYEEYVARNGRMENITADPLRNPIAAVARPQRTERKAMTEDELLKMAHDIVNNIYNADESTMDSFRKAFRRYANADPEDYLKTHSGNPQRDSRP